MRDLNQQVVIVFGASSGIGRSAAISFGIAGARVVVAARRGDELETLADRLCAEGRQVVPVVADVREREQVDAAIALALQEFGGLDVVVNTAGVNTQERRLDVLRRAEWDRLLDVNLNGAFNTLQAPLAHFRDRGGGLIVQVASVSARFGDFSGAAYQASKAGIVGLCQAAMVEERLNGLRVTAILPGLVDTPMPMRRPIPPPRELLDRAMHPDDVAAACVFLASLPERTYIPELVMLPGHLQCIGQTAI